MKPFEIVSSTKFTEITGIPCKRISGSKYDLSKNAHITLKELLTNDVLESFWFLHTFRPVRVKIEYIQSVHVYA